MVQLTRLSRRRRSAYSLASACCGAQKVQSTPATTRLPDSRNAGYSVSSNFLSAVRAVRKSPAEAVLATAKRVAKRKRLVSAQPQETTASGTPSDEPKSRKLHQCELVGSTHVSPPNPRIKSQNPKGGFGALWRVFLRYLSSRKERYRPRRDQRLDAVSESVKTQQLKTIAPRRA